eukprot:SAG11_NODE_25083_length_364_cov_0.532075_1_plen_35_part_01
MDGYPFLPNDLAGARVWKRCIACARIAYARIACAR